MSKSVVRKSKVVFPKVAAKVKAAPKVKLGTEVEVNVILDRSGSMIACRDKTISGFNEYLNGLKADTETKYWITLVEFDAPHRGGASKPEFMVVYDKLPLAEVRDLTLETFVPRGGTPLHDAIGWALGRPRHAGRAVINLIITDGAENSSREFTAQSVKGWVEKCQAEGETFVYLGANQDAVLVGATLGFDRGSTVSYGVQNTNTMFAAMAVNTVNRSNAYRASGQSACMDAFVPDEQRDELVK